MSKRYCPNEYCPVEYCSNDMDADKTQEVIEGLNVYLANLAVLYIKLHNLHWNVVGVGFFDLHKKTQELYEQITEMFDQVAERIKAFGCYPLASMHEYAETATICELPSRDFSSPCVAKIILEDFCATLKLLQKIDAIAKDTDDECTINLLAEAMCFFGKNIWFFNAYLTRCQ